MTAPVIRGLRHLALKVTDIRRSRAFYERLFDMRVVWQPDPDHVYLTSGSDNLALHQIPFEELGEYLGTHGQFMGHFGFVVETPQDESYSVYLADPDDNTIQVLYEPRISGLELMQADERQAVPTPNS